MIKSMTGFAKATHTRMSVTADVTLRSVNGRYLDPVLFLPETCHPFEDQIKPILSRHHQRGRIELRVSVQDQQAASEQFVVDEAKTAAWFKALTRVKDYLGLTEGPTLDHLLTNRDLILPAMPAPDRQSLWEAVSTAVEAAAQDLDQMRMKEGEILYRDLTRRLDDIEAIMQGVGDLAREIPVIYKQRLTERLARLTEESSGLDPIRLAQETAVLADKSDVSEEIVRVGSHIVQFRQLMDGPGPQGKTLNFLIQEFNREFNTIGSKAGSARLSHTMVDLKSRLEKIREQVQNIE